MYAQTLQGDTWKGEKMDKGKIDKMSGTYNASDSSFHVLMQCRSANRSAVRTHASDTEASSR
jgi:hypothetical protein